MLVWNGLSLPHRKVLVKKCSKSGCEQVSSSRIWLIFYPNPGSRSSSLSSCAVRPAHPQCLPSSR